MRYFIRFIIDDDKEITLDAIEAGIKSIDPDFKFAGWDRECELAELFHGNELYGEMELMRLDPDDIDDEIVDLMEDVETAVDGDKDEVIACLKNAKAMLVILVVLNGRVIEDTLDTISPVWNWLFDHYQGLLQADGEGYYDSDNLILKVELPESKEGQDEPNV